MPPPPTSNLRVVKYAQGWGYAASEWERALRAIDWSKPHAQGGPERLKIRTLHDGTEDATVWRAALALGTREHEVVLKVEPLDTLKKSIQALLRRTKAFRQWRGAVVLDRIKPLQVAAPAAVLRGTRAEMLVLKNLDGPTLLELAAGPAPRVHTEQQIARAFAGEMARLAIQGKGGADLKGSNIVVTGLGGTGSPEPRIALLDTLDVARTHRVHPLFPLVAELVGTGHLPRRATLMRFSRAFVREFANQDPAAPSDLEPGHAEWARGERRALWRVLSAALHAHGDATPKDDPLARG